MKKLIFLAGGVTGYVLGSRAGRERYEQIAALSRRVANLPPVQKAADAASAQAANLADSAKHTMSDKLSDAVAEGRHRFVEKFGERFGMSPEPAPFAGYPRAARDVADTNGSLANGQPPRPV